MDTETRTDAGRIDELEARLRQLETTSIARPRGWFRAIMPAEATQHFRAAGREQLLGMRALVDFWIKRLDQADEARASGRAGREEITIE